MASCLKIQRPTEFQTESVAKSYLRDSLFEEECKGDGIAGTLSRETSQIPIARAREVVKLLGVWACPFVIRARIALNIKGVAYKFLEEKYGTKSELLLKLNPVYKKIQVLIHHGKAICESMIIVQYIDDFWTATEPSILPTDPHERALARFWTVYIDDKLLPSFGIMKATTKEATREAIGEVFAGLQLLKEVLEKHNKEKRFFGGETIGYIDIALGWLLGLIGAVDKIADVKLLDRGKTPQLVGWAERFWSLDAIKGVIPDIKQFVELGKIVQARMTAEATK